MPLNKEFLVCQVRDHPRRDNRAVIQKQKDVHATTRGHIRVLRLSSIVFQLAECLPHQSFLPQLFPQPHENVSHKIWTVYGEAVL